MAAKPIAFDLIDKVYRTWGTDWKERDVREAEIKTLQSSDSNEICGCISGLYGIFDATMKGDTYTYYFWDSDVTLDAVYNKHGAARYREFKKTVNCYRVDYNIRTGERKCVQTSRYNKRCLENAGCML